MKNEKKERIKKALNLNKYYIVFVFIWVILFQVCNIVRKRLYGDKYLFITYFILFGIYLFVSFGNIIRILFRKDSEL